MPRITGRHLQAKLISGDLCQQASERQACPYIGMACLFKIRVGKRRSPSLLSMRAPSKSTVPRGTLEGVCRFERQWQFVCSSVASQRQRSALLASQAEEAGSSRRSGGQSSMFWTTLRLAGRNHDRVGMPRAKGWRWPALGLVHDGSVKARPASFSAFSTNSAT